VIENCCETRIARAGLDLRVQCRHGGDGRTVGRRGGRPVPQASGHVVVPQLVWREKGRRWCLHTVREGLRFVLRC